MSREINTMNLFSTLDELSSEQLHPKYKNLLSSEFKSYREIIQGWTDGFIDRDNKIVKEFQTTYHSSIWEFYLYALFKELGFELDQTHDRPDFIIKKPYEVYIEAVISNIKNRGLPERNRNIEDIMSMFIPPYEQKDFYSTLNEAIIRQANSLSKKREKYKKNYSKCSWIDSKKPYIVALSSYDQINYGREYIYPMMALLYGKYYNPIKEAYENKSSIEKEGTQLSVPIGIFNDMQYSDISAVLYTSTLSTGKISSLSISRGDTSQNEVYCLYRDYENAPFYKLNIVNCEAPENLADGVFVFHNPNARNKLPLEYFSNECITQFTINSHGNIEHTNVKNLMVRTDFPKIMKSGFDILIKEYVRHYNKVSMKEFYDIQLEDGSVLITDEIDFSNDCCVYIIGTNTNQEKHNGTFLRCKIERPCVMPDEMLRHEATNIANKLIKDKTMGSLLKIIIVRNNIEYMRMEELFNECS